MKSVKNKLLYFRPLPVFGLAIAQRDGKIDYDKFS